MKHAIGIALVLFTYGCVGPSMMGFPHSSMHPAGGTEFAVVPYAGGGYGSSFDGGGMLSVAHDFGNVGMSVSAGAYVAWGVNLHGHIEIARRLKDPRNDLLFGVGYAQNITSDQGSPQLSVGFLRAAPLYTRGGFGGFRISGGPIFTDLQSAGSQFFVSGAVGYQWWASKVFGFSMQLVPFMGLYDVDDIQFVGGALAMFSFTFGNRSTDSPAASNN